MRNLLYILLFFVFAQQATAQQGNRFDYQIQRLDSVNYELRLQISNVEDVQFIQIKLLESGEDFKIMEASLNKKRDGKYYLFFEGEESFVLPRDIKVSFDQSLDGIEINEVHLDEPSIIVDLLDANNNILEFIQKTID